MNCFFSLKINSWNTNLPSNKDLKSSLILPRKRSFQRMIDGFSQRHFRLLSVGPPFPHIHYKILLRPLKTFPLEERWNVCMDVITPQNHSKRAKKILLSSANESDYVLSGEQDRGVSWGRHEERKTQTLRLLRNSVYCQDVLALRIQVVTVSEVKPCRGFMNG